MSTVLITGHKGLVGRHLWPLLKQQGFNVKGFDLSDQSGDITNTIQLEQALIECHGVIHLAAVSRVIWGQQNFEKCWKTNALASENLLKLAAKSALKPWVLVASSREVYGEPKELPVTEDMLINPINIYGKSKVYMEEKTLKARERGINTAIVRLANVYGCSNDHPDRVIPSFCYNAVQGGSLRIEGAKNLLDFTHITDVILGIEKLVKMLECKEANIPPIHLLPGIGTTLFEAAKIAINAANTEAEIIHVPPRTYDVASFVGNPDRAHKLLDWKAKIPPKQGIGLLVKSFQKILNSIH